MLERAISLLHVEDDTLVASATMRSLERHATVEISTTLATSLTDAQAMLATAKFDLVLLDLNLPDSQGVDTLARLRASAPQTAIIVLTGQYDPSLPEKVFALGAEEYLHKEIALGSILWRAVHHTVERARAHRALRESEARLRDLSRKFVDAQEAERRNLALWLHDELAQTLSALKLTLRSYAQARPEDRARIHAESERLIDEQLARVRALSLDLRPPMLDDLGLLHALLWLVERIQSQTGVRVDFAHTGLDARVEPAVETAAYRIVQTALANVALHADTDAANVRLWRTEDAVHVEIADEGVGFVVDGALSRPTAVGLASIRERARLLGGEANVDSSPGAGTRICVSLPATSPSTEEELG